MARQSEGLIFRKLEQALRNVKEPEFMDRKVPTADIPLPPRILDGNKYPAERVPYAPTPNDPARLANMTVQSVGKIGDVGAEEIDKVRAQLRQAFEEIDAKLQELGEAFRGHAHVAQAHVSGFCLQTTRFFETISAAHRTLLGQAEPETAEHLGDETAPASEEKTAVGEDASELPEFLRQ